MNITSLKINNILSIENAEIHFGQDGLVLVEGYNHDLGRANGAGKTAIFNALAFALFDKLPRKITASEILRRGTTKGSASVELICGSDVYTVSRSRPKNVQFKKNGEVINITQDEWETIIKLSYNQFLISVYCSQRSDNRFLSLNDADKKNFLLQLLDLDRFANLKKESDDKIKELTTQVNNITSQINSCSAKIEAYSESVQDVKVLKQEQEKLDKQIKELTAVIDSLQEVLKPDISNYVKLESQINSKEKEISTAKTVKSMLHTQYRKLSSTLKEFDMSPVCDQCGSSMDLTKAKCLHDKEQEDVKVQMQELKREIDEKDVIISKESEIATFKSKIAAKKSKELELYDQSRASIQEHRSIVSRHQIKYDNNVIKLQENDQLLSKINDLSTLKNKLDLDAVKKVKDLEFYKTLSLIYSPTGAQAYILDSVIDSFNEIVSGYVQLVWPSAHYELNSYRENAKGDVTAKFSESLNIDGQGVSVGSLSGGEMRALSLCIDFTIMDIMQNNFSIQINPTILDEPFEGLDAIGKEIVIELLEKIAVNRQILVVDHSSELKAMFSKVISVEKRNGISTIKVEA